MTRFLTLVAAASVSLTGCFLAQLYALPKFELRPWTFGEVFVLWSILFLMKWVMAILLEYFKTGSKQ